MFWVVNYFLLLLSLIIIFKCFNKKNSLLIIITFIFLQVADTSAGLKKYFNPFSSSKESYILQDQLWDDLFNKHKVIKTTYPVNWSRMFTQFSFSMEKYNIKKTNLVIFGRGNRKFAAQARYDLYNNFREKKLIPYAVYIIDGLSHLRHLKYIYKDESVGFFYRDNVWSMVLNEKERMNENDKKLFEDIKLKLLPSNEIKDFNFRENDNYYGLGWSHNLEKLGIWSEGFISTLFFRTDAKYKNKKLEIICRPYITKKNNTLEFDVYVNNSFNKKFKLNNKNKDSKIEIAINEENPMSNEIKIDFKFKNLFSPHEVYESPDSRKLGILLKSIKITSI